MSLTDVLRVAQPILNHLMGNGNLTESLFEAGEHLNIDMLNGLIEWEMNGACVKEAHRVVPRKAGTHHIVADVFVDIAKIVNGKYVAVQNPWGVEGEGIAGEGISLDSELHMDFWARIDGRGCLSGRLPKHWLSVPQWTTIELIHDTSRLASAHAVPENVVRKIVSDPIYLSTSPEGALQILNEQEVEVSADSLESLLSALHAGEIIDAVVQARTVCIGTIQRPWVKSLACCCRGVREIVQHYPRPPRVYLIPHNGVPALAVPLNGDEVVWHGKRVTKWAFCCYRDWDFVKENIHADKDAFARMVLHLRDCQKDFKKAKFLKHIKYNLEEPEDTLGYVRSLDDRWSPSSVTLRRRTSTMIKVTDQMAYDTHFAAVKRSDV